MRVSNYTLNYSGLFRTGEIDIFGFLALCRELKVDGASIHIVNLPDTSDDFLKRVRRAYLDNGLSVSMFSVTTDFGSEENATTALETARRGIHIARFLGAPCLRVFPGLPESEEKREESFQRAVRYVRKVSEEASEYGLPIALQNHNHGALCRTGRDVVRFLKLVDHPNFTHMLDCGQFAGSPGASAAVPPELRGEDYLESIQETASVASYVRTKFYLPSPTGADQKLDYNRIFEILRGVHYDGFVDIVYEPAKYNGENVLTAMPRIVNFLRSKIAANDDGPAAARMTHAGHYAELNNGNYFEDGEFAKDSSLTFTEGPACDAAGNVYFTHMTEQRIVRFDSQARQLTTFRENARGANGLLFDRRGRLLACEGRAGQVTRTDMKTGEVTVLANEYNGKPLGAPNDLTMDGEGRIYFTSRLGNRDPEKGNVNSVYRIDAPGKIARVLHWPNIDMPNGIVTSPDNKVIYLIDADGTANRARRVRAYELKSDGVIGKEWLLYDFFPGRSGDGMCIDAEGNLYVAAGLHQRRGTSETLDTRPGIHVISPAGKLVAFLETSEDTITNCTFGGPDLRTLYVTCGKLLLSVRTRIPGKAAYRPG